MERQKALSGLILVVGMSMLTNACNDDADTIDATGGAPAAGTSSGGNAGSGKAGSGAAGEGGDASGGKAGGSSGSAGSGTSGSSGNSSGGSGADGSGGMGGEGGMPFGGEGGEPMGGGSGLGGTSGAGGSIGGLGGSGGSNGGSGGSTSGAGGAGSGGTGGNPPEYCYDHLYIPLAEEGDQADFEVQYPSTIDLSNTVITVRLRADALGNGGGLQVYLKNGAPQNYASVYLGWNSLSNLSDWTTLTYDIASITPANANFDKTAVEWVGMNITTGSDFEGAVWDDVDVYVDSITFSDGASTDLDFNSSSTVLGVNQFNYPVAGAAVSAGICEADPGSGGAGGGGAGGSAGDGGSSAGGAGSGGGGTGGAGSGGDGAGGLIVTGGFGGMGAAGEAGMGASGEGGMGASGEGGMGGFGGDLGGAGTASGGTAGTGNGPANLIQNGDFESGETTGWYSWGTGTFGTSTLAHSGEYSLLVTGRTGSNINIVQDITAVVSLGNTYTVSAYVRTSAATTGHFTAQIVCTESDPEYTWIQGYVNLDDAGWVNLAGTLELTSPCEGGTFDGVNLYFEGPEEGIDVYLDDVVMTLD